jgi:hypothetical protein
MEAATDATELADDIGIEDTKELDFIELEFVGDEFFPEAPPPQATNALEHITKNIARIIISISTQIQNTR